MREGYGNKKGVTVDTPQFAQQRERSIILPVDEMVLGIGIEREEWRDN